MKYLKLFEDSNSDSKYELIKELPKSGVILTTKTDELDALVNYLKMHEYRYHNNWEIHPNKLLQGILWIEDNDKTMYQLGSTHDGLGMLSIKEINPKHTTIQFDDYFTFTHAYRGLNLQKTYGL